MSEPLGRHWRDGDGDHIDVSDLPPPEPMVAVLELIDRPGIDGPVIVHHTREPLLLYPELAERGWDHEVISHEPGRIRVKLTRLP